ncbi:YjeF N-terminal domain-like protein [Suhomyces tanzawaensis NRRL Y-17324]|uniref:Enhancer of mRNA-decapping protein 3 n=1 Tax=Suhomyces tanzawaensis NRRL Y-17324 TaxID=984487 RepID=A0A1E4SC95_9ASCO|nr:YjeF N-terminal domain-like protein [Suhomyces tanzawaensis NRRL Y-17324]ODV77012.1 YjeF N-terminal domain-like protein [Suhomyces tanzawaensis NRRL Y-17324]
MAEFLNYKVDLTLKDGTRSSGVITHVDNRQISLGNATQSSFPGQTIPNLQVNSSQIADLKVIQLPPDFYKGGRGKKPKADTPSLLDSAIIFAKTSAPSSREDKSIDSPKTKAPKKTAARSNSPTGSVDPDWGNDGGVKDIKASTDFDFAANLAMFDKKSVFADFQKKDTVNPGDRLVGHNRIEQGKGPKTKKEKYDNDEMVLDSKKNDNWDNIGNTSKVDLTKHKASHSSTPVYKDPVTNQNLKLVHSSTMSPIPLSSPVQLLEIERLSSESYGITPPIMAEVLATNLSQLIATQMLGGSSRLNKKNHNLPPLVLLLIGSARCGSRAFATGRHLTNHGVRVLAFVINTEDTDKDLTTQWQLFENGGGKVITSSVPELLSIINHQLDTPVELIIDALQGYDDHLEDIFYLENDQQVLRSLMEWANEPSQQSKILSLDIPSGIDGGSGTLLDQSLKLNCRWCVSMGLPITGLIHAYKNGYLDVGEVTHYLIDVGIPNKVYSSKGNLRKFDRFWHSAESCVKLEVASE